MVFMVAYWNKPRMRRIYFYIEAGGACFLHQPKAAFCRVTSEAIITIVSPKIASVFSELVWKAKLSAVDIAGGCMASRVMMRTMVSTSATPGASKPVPSKETEPKPRGAALLCAMRNVRIRFVGCSGSTRKALEAREMTIRG